MRGDINSKSNFVSYVLTDIIIFVYEVPLIFWHYINVDEVSWIALKTLWQSAMELLQIATAFLLQSATRFITNCDRYYKVWWIYYKLRQILQSAMIITNCDGTPSLPQIYSSVFTNLRNVCKEQSCANLLFRPVINLTKDWIPTFQDINKCILHLFTTLLKHFFS